MRVATASFGYVPGKPVRTGVDLVASGVVDLNSSARIGLLTNRAARTCSGTWTGEALRSAGYRIVFLLAPEHGLDVATPAGEPISHSQMDDVPVLSMYGADMTPVEDAMSKIDVLVIDLPDVGCRYYTYPWTVREALRMASREGLQVVLLDRPNPLGGAIIEGNLPDQSVDSAVCASPVPVRHGLTVGELALWNRRSLALDVDLRVVPSQGWERGMLWDETGLPWTDPSPALSSFDAVVAYPGTCLLEGTNISEGRGTDRPFLMLGAPFVNASELAHHLNGSEMLEGATISETAFTPTSSKWAGQECRGVRFEIVDAESFRAVAAGVTTIAALCPMPGFEFLEAHFDALAGTSDWRSALQRGLPPQDITSKWREDEVRFGEARETVLLYS